MPIEFVCRSVEADGTAEAVSCGVRKLLVFEPLEPRLLLDAGLPVQTVQSLDGTWELQRTTADEVSELGQTWQTVSVPSHLSQVEAPYAWYRRDFSLPADWQGGHMFLAFGGVKYAAQVYVNGVLAGGHYGGWEPFEIDITGLGLFGQTNQVLVRVQDVRAVIEGDVPYQPGVNMVESVQSRVLAPVGSQPHLLGIWEGVQLVYEKDVLIEDLTVVTSFRQDLIEATYVLRNLSGTPREVTLQASVEDGETLALGMGQVAVTVPAAGTVEVVLAQPWADAELWMPDSPQLYYLESSLSNVSGQLDLERTRFGFREFWIEGTDFVLNGVPMHFLATAGHPPWDGRLLSNDEIRAKYEEIRSANVVGMRLHANIWPENWYQVADEVGLPIIQESAIWCYAYNYALENPQFWQNARDHWEGVIGRDKNHPSVVMYSIENEILHVGGNRVAETEVNLGDLGRFVKSLDPTRPIMYDGDEDPDGAADVINLHYPHEFPTNTLYPNTAYWVNEETRVEGWPYTDWLWGRTKPLYIGEFLWVPAASAHTLTGLLGDEAYRDLSTSLHTAKAMAWEMQIEAYRASGVSGMTPWTLWESGTFPNEQYYAVQRAYEPNAAIVREYDTRFFAGEQVQRTVLLYNDTLYAANLTLQWSVAGQLQGQMEFSLPPAGRVEQVITLTMPQVDAATDAPLELVVKNGDETVYSAVHDYRVFPQAAPQFGLPQGVRVFFYGADARTLEFLRSGGVEPLILEDLAQVSSADSDVLIIGAHALDPLAGSATVPSVGGSAYERLTDFVAAGGTVLVLEQDAYPAGMLPASLGNQAATIAFERATSDPLFEGLGQEAYKFWRGDHFVTRRAIARPQEGGFRVLVDAGGPNGLDRVLLVEMFHGQGRYILSQLLISEKLDSEPAANVTLERLVSRAGTAAAARTTVGVVTGPRALLPELTALGVRFDDLTGALAVADLSGYRVLVVDGTAPEVIANRALLQQFAQAGGKVVLHGLDNASLQGLADTLPVGLTVVQNLSVPVLIREGADEVTVALTNEDLHWIFDWSGDWRTRHPLSTDVLYGEVIREAPPLEQSTVIEAETFTMLNPGAGYIGGGELCLYANGSIEKQIELPQTGDYFFGVVGRGSAVDGVYPDVAVYLDGVLVGHMNIASAQSARYYVTGPATAGTHTVRLSFVNDAWKPEVGQDRNVWFDKFFYAPKPVGPEVELLQPAGLVKVADGQGFWLMDQVKWDGRAGSFEPASRYLSGLLTNLGAEFATQAAGLRLPASYLDPVGQIPYYSEEGDTVFLCTNGTVTGDVEFLQAGTYQFVVKARGSVAAGEYPNVRLLLDGQAVGDQQLQSGGWEELTYSADIVGGVHSIGLRFTNDLWLPDIGEDRNLWINEVRIVLLEADERLVDDGDGDYADSGWTAVAAPAAYEGDYRQMAPALVPVLFSGMSYTPWWENALLTPESDQSIADMAAIGVDTVALNVWWFQDDVNSTVITPDFTRYSASTDSVIHAIKEVHSQGMRVMLKPMVDLRDGTWRGLINPSAAWFAGYADFINYWAAIAQAEAVELFSVGCEFNRTDSWTEAWRDVVSGVRGLYNGPLTYAANHDSYQTVAWWDVLDYIGIDAYFALTSENDPTLGELQTAWQTHESNIESWLLATDYGLPVLFTEVGYRSADGANQRPWEWWGGQPVDLQEQVDCYEALLTTLWEEPWWGGAFWWNWETDPDAGGPANDGFTPQNKPVEQLLASYYNAPEPGDEWASWTFTGLPAGAYEVYATWVTDAAAATDAPYQVFDDATYAGTARVSQLQAPDDVAWDARWWESLGVFTVESGTLIVQLTNDADGLVIADAVRLIARPTARDDAYILAEDGMLSVAAPGVLVNDSQPDGVPLVTSLLRPVGHGALTLNGDGSFSYTPEANYFGEGSFDYLVSDGTGGTAEGTVFLTVVPVNDPPTAADDAYAVDEGAVLSVSAAGGVLANDADVDGDALTAELLGGPAHGALTLNGDGSFTYAPAPGFWGQDSFQYRAADGSGGVDTATVLVTVVPVNTPPVLTAVETLMGGQEDTVFPVSYADVAAAADEWDADGDVLSFRIESVMSGALTKDSAPVVPGSTLLAPGESMAWTPVANGNGTLDAFTVTAWDGRASSGVPVPVRVQVQAANDSPTAAAQSVQVPMSGSIQIALAGTDLETPTGELAFALVTAPGHGAVSLSGNVVTYLPALGYVGPDSFTFAVTDTGDPAGSHANPGDLTSGPATVAINVLSTYRYIGVFSSPRGPRVYVYDCDATADVSLSSIQVTWGSGSSVSSVKLVGSQPLSGLGIAISGASSVGSIKDGRRGPKGNLAFIASNASIKTIQLKSGITGFNLNGLTLGGLTFASDIDGDGSDRDLTAIYCLGTIGSMQISGPVLGDIWIGGSSAKGSSLNSFSTEQGGYHGDLSAPGNVGVIALGGTFGSSMRIGGSLSKLKIKGGNLSGLLDVAGSVGTIRVSGGTQPGTRTSLGGLLTAGSNVLAGGRLNRLGASGYDEVNNGQRFGILAGGLGRVSLGGLVLQEEDVPFADGDFRVVVQP